MPKLSISGEVQRRRPGDDSRNAPLKLSTIKAGTEVRIHLGAFQTKKLYESLRDLYAIGEAGTPQEKQTLTVVNVNEAFIATGREREVLERLLQSQGEASGTCSSKSIQTLRSVWRSPRYMSRRIRWYWTCIPRWTADFTGNVAHESAQARLNCSGQKSRTLFFDGARYDLRIHEN
jgi:hypothetical protein